MKKFSEKGGGCLKNQKTRFSTLKMDSEPRKNHSPDRNRTCISRFERPTRVRFLSGESFFFEALSPFLRSKMDFSDLITYHLSPKIFSFELSQPALFGISISGVPRLEVRHSWEWYSWYRRSGYWFLWNRYSGRRNSGEQIWDFGQLPSYLCNKCRKPPIFILCEC